MKAIFAVSFNKKNSFLKSIQILRGIAALAVVFYHYANYAFPKISTGGFGVDIFFVISGFIIAYISSKTTDQFFKKRLIRIVPLYYVVLFFTLFLLLIFPAWFYNTKASLPTLIKSLLFIPSGNRIVLIAWTLYYEMFFYIIMALCIFFIKNKKRLTLACGVAIIVILIILNIFSVDYGGDFGNCLKNIGFSNEFVFGVIYALKFFQYGLMPEFIFGLIVFNLYDYFSKKNLGKNNFRTVVLVLIAISSFLFLVMEEPFKFDFFGRNIQRGIPSALLVISMLMLEKEIRDGKLMDFGMILGDASYAMYLIHPFSVYFCQRLIYPRIFNGADNLFLEIIKVLIVLVFSIITSIYAFKLIDDPLQKWLRNIFIKKRKT